METAFDQPIGNRIRQGDVLSGLEIYEVTDLRADGEGRPVFSGRSVHRGFAVVVTQDCDLEWDFNARQQPPTAGPDKLLYEVLLCGVHEEDRFLSGKYREGAQEFGKKQSQWNIVRQNREPRFQYLGCLSFGPSQPTNVVADFKDFFSVPCEYLYKMLSVESAVVKRVASLQAVYREHLLQRFGWFLTRIGLQKDFHEFVVGVAATTMTPPGLKGSPPVGKPTGS